MGPDALSLSSHEESPTFREGKGVLRLPAHSDRWPAAVMGGRGTVSDYVVTAPHGAAQQLAAAGFTHQTLLRALKFESPFDQIQILEAAPLIRGEMDMAAKQKRSQGLHHDSMTCYICYSLYSSFENLSKL